MKYFIAQTPYHILMCQSVFRRLRKEAEKRVDAVLVVAGYARQALDVVDSQAWSAVSQVSLEGEKAWSRKPPDCLRELEAFCGEGGDGIELFVCDDMNWRLQVLCHWLRPTKISLIEDGLGAYHVSRLTRQQWLFRNLVLRLFQHGRVRHFGAVNHSTAETYYALREEAFPWRPDRSRLITVVDEFREEVHALAEGVQLPEAMRRRCSVIVTQPLSEGGILDVAGEMGIWVRVAEWVADKTSVVVKKHPREDSRLHQKRVDAISRAINANVTDVTESIPFELYVPLLGEGSEVIAFNSTAIYNGAILRDDVGFRCIELSKEGELKMTRAG